MLEEKKDITKALIVTTKHKKLNARAQLYHKSQILLQQ